MPYSSRFAAAVSSSSYKVLYRFHCLGHLTVFSTGGSSRMLGRNLHQRRVNNFKLLRFKQSAGDGANVLCGNVWPPEHRRRLARAQGSRAPPSARRRGEKRNTHAAAAAGRTRDENTGPPNTHIGAAETLGEKNRCSGQASLRESGPERRSSDQLQYNEQQPQQARCTSRPQLWRMRWNQKIN